MTGELLAFRRAATGGPVADYGRVVDAARVGLGSSATQVAMAGADATASVAGLVVTASATPHTKGDWTELIASTAFTARRFEVIVRGVSTDGTNTGILLDIGVGAAASEVVLIPNLMTGYISNITGNYCEFEFPVSIPAGSRIAARIQGTVVSETQRVAVRLHAGGTHSVSGSTITAIGVDPATSNAVTLTAPAGLNQKGAYAEIVAATAADYRWLVVALSAQGTAVTATEEIVDIAIGGAGSEVVCIPDIGLALTAAEEIRYAGSRAYTLNIPAGTRISARYSALTSAAAGTRPTVAVYGIS